MFTTDLCYLQVGLILSRSLCDECFEKFMQHMNNDREYRTEVLVAIKYYVDSGKSPEDAVEYILERLPFDATHGEKRQTDVETDPNTRH